MMDFESYESFSNSRGRNDRYEYASVIAGGEKYFYKRAKTTDLKDNLVREVAWSEFMSFITQYFPESRLEGPIIKDRDNDGILMNYIDAPHLANSHDLLARWKACIPQYARMLHTLDQAADGWSTEKGSTAIDYGRHRTENVFDVWGEWLGKNASKVRRLSEAKSLVNDYRSSITTRMQHGDLTPWQIFDSNGTWIIYDGEKCGTDLARYNDLAYGYGRLATVLRSPSTAAELLQMFIEQVDDLQLFTNQFMPVLVGRAIGMLSDALHDQDSDNYVEYAERLLDVVLSRDLKNLLENR